MALGFLFPWSMATSRFRKNRSSRKVQPSRKIYSKYADDGIFSSAAIQLFRKAIEKETHQMSKQKGYDGLVEDCRYLQKHRNPEEQRAAVYRVISSLFCAPTGVQLFRSLLATMPVTWAFHLSPCQAHTIENEPLKRGIFIPKCRFLEESQCKGMCVNMCKIPTQQFFNNTLGFPFTMEPNYETGSCQITFGKTPLPLEQDAAVQIKCSGKCSSKKVSDTSFQLKTVET